MKNLLHKWNQISLVKRILVGLIIGVILALTIPDVTGWLSIFGSLFVGALKAVAPVLVLFIVMHALSKHREGQQTNIKTVVVLYMVGTFLAGFIAVFASFLFPSQLITYNQRARRDSSWRYFRSHSNLVV